MQTDEMLQFSEESRGYWHITFCRAIGRAKKPPTIKYLFVVPLPTAQCRAMHRHCKDDVSGSPHRGLLRARRQRPRRRTAEQRDEVPAFHTDVSRASDRNDSTAVQRCGISIWPMSAAGRCC